MRAGCAKALRVRKAAGCASKIPFSFGCIRDIITAALKTSTRLSWQLPGSVKLRLSVAAGQ